MTQKISKQWIVNPDAFERAWIIFKPWQLTIMRNPSYLNSAFLGLLSSVLILPVHLAQGVLGNLFKLQLLRALVALLTTPFLALFLIIAGLLGCVRALPGLTLAESLGSNKLKPEDAARFHRAGLTKKVYHITDPEVSERLDSLRTQDEEKFKEAMRGLLKAIAETNPEKFRTM